MRDGMYTREVSAEEQAFVEKHADKLVPLCPARDCEKTQGHDGAHGPIVFNTTSLKP